MLEERRLAEERARVLARAGRLIQRIARGKVGRMRAVRRRKELHWIAHRWSSGLILTRKKIVSELYAVLAISMNIAFRCVSRTSGPTSVQVLRGSSRAGETATGGYQHSESVSRLSWSHSCGTNLIPIHLALGMIYAVWQFRLWLGL